MRFQKLFEQFYSKFKAWSGRKKSRGQSLVELALFLPILLIMLSGLVEFGFGLNQYINIVEATREGARFGVDGDPGNEPFKNDPARAARGGGADPAPRTGGAARQGECIDRRRSRHRTRGHRRNAGNRQAAPTPATRRPSRPAPLSWLARRSAHLCRRRLCGDPYGAGAAKLVAQYADLSEDG